MRNLSEWLAVGSATADAWVSLADLNLLIFVGLTGVGKTTTLTELSALVDYTLLPNRRTLTDELQIAELQIADGDPVATVQDRAARFAYTRRYREQYKGGMAHALMQLMVKRDDLLPELLLFDGLRGANEVLHAVNHLPHAQFVVLMASDFVRVQRLLSRNDQFDQIGTMVGYTERSGEDILGDAASIFVESERRKLVGLVESGAVEAEALQAKLKIVMAERQNYDQDTSCAVLEEFAPERTLVVNTNLHAPSEVARQIAAFV